MSLTTIPITFYLSFEQPEGVTLVPQIVGGLGDRSVGFNPRVSNSHDAEPTEPQPPTTHASVETGVTGAHASVEMGEKDALIERLRAENRQLEEEAELLRDALIRLSADSLGFDPRKIHDAMAPAVESNGRAPSANGKTDSKHAAVKAAATDPPDCIPGYQPRTSTNGRTSPAETNGHASVKANATNGHAAVDTAATNGHAPVEPLAAADPDAPDYYLDHDFDNGIDHDYVAPDVVTSDAAEAPLSPRHQIALFMLVGGSTIVEIARELKVDSGTVGRWMRKPNFVARYQRYMRECDHAIHRRLQAISRDAVEVVGAHVNKGSLRAAVHMLKGRGFLSGQKNTLVPILEADPVAAPEPAPEPVSEPTPIPTFPQRAALNGHVYAGIG